MVKHIYLILDYVLKPHSQGKLFFSQNIHCFQKKKIIYFSSSWVPKPNNEAYLTYNYVHSLSYKYLTAYYTSTGKYTELNKLE